MNQENGKQDPTREGASSPGTEARVPVVGIGASAGGIEALKELLSVAPPDSGLAFVVIQHLAPGHESQMPRLLAERTSLRLVEAAEGMTVEPDTVYTIPPGSYLSLAGNRLHVEPPVHARGVRMPIDFFFRSLAEERPEKAVCVVLSGSGSDGTLGVRAVRGAGGLAIAQDPSTAEFDSMPRSALATGLVDLVLAPHAIVPAILRYAGRASLAAPLPEPAQDASDALQAILNLLLRAGADFRGYKPGTITRRIERRMGLAQATTLASYLQLLKEKPEEVSSLAKDILIGVTGFFRDPEAYKELREVAIRPLVGVSEEERPLRVWVAGCATGEEAYSLAILLLEELEAAGKHVPLQIFASDLDTEALAFARAGVYPESIAADVSPERLARFFMGSDHGYTIAKGIRDTVVFTAHNVAVDPPFSRVDLVSCRNVLVYLGEQLQRRVTSFLAFALNPGGYLFLGRSDNLPTGTETFAPVSSRWRIFTRTSVMRHEMVEFPEVRTRAASPLSTPRGLTTPPGQLMAVAQRLLLAHYAASLVLIDARGDILYFQGNTEKYLRHATGTPDVNLFAMAREKLPRRLRAVVRQALGTGEPVRLEQTPVESAGGTSFVNVTVWPTAGTVSDQQQAAVIFEEAQPAAVAPAEAPQETDANGTPPLVGQLESELRATREELRATLAEHAVAAEELRAANEEAVSMNEELRSTNEELESSKEELQSVNEELTTLNAELSDKIDELNESNSDLANLFSATEIATIFLDRELRIRRFTPAATNLLSLLPVDVGRPISDIAPHFRGHELVPLAERVLRELSPTEEEVQMPDGRWYLMRLLPYRSLQDRVEGAVVTFTEVTQLKLAEQASEEARVYAESIVATVREPLLVLDPHLRVLSANPGFYRTFGVTREETGGRLLADLGNRQWDIPQLVQVLAQVVPTQTELEDFEVEHAFPGIGHRNMLLNARRIEPGNGRPLLILLAIEDITARKRFQLAEAMVAEVSHRTKNNLAIVAGLLQMQADRQPGRTSTALIRDAITRIHTFAALYEQLQAGESEQIELLGALRRVAEIARTTLSAENVEIRVEGEMAVYSFQDATNLAVVANELITNALKYGAPDADGVLRVRVSVQDADGELTLSVWNSGNPIAGGFDPAVVTATGLYLVRSIVVDHYRGELRLEPQDGGTRAQIVITKMPGSASMGDAG